MRSGNVSDADIARGKAGLKASVLSATDSYESQIENLSQQALFKGQIIPASAIVAEIEKVSAADVKNVRNYFYIFPN